MSAEQMQNILREHVDQADTDAWTDEQVFFYAMLRHAIAEAARVGIISSDTDQTPAEPELAPAGRLEQVKSLYERPVPVGETVALTIIGAIRAGQMVDGEPLIEDRIGSALGVSRTLVREGVQRLQSAGIAERRPRCSSTVSTKYIPESRERNELK